MSEYPTVEDVRQALRARAEEYQRRLYDLRQQLRDEGKDAVDPGHSAGANSLKLEIDSTEQVLNTLPKPESVRRLVVCCDPETGEEAAFALVCTGHGGTSLDIRGVRVQTLSPEAPAAADLVGCHVGDDTPLGRVIAVQDDEA